MEKKMNKIYFCEPSESLRATIMNYYKDSADYDVKVFSESSAFCLLATTESPDAVVLDLDFVNLREVYNVIEEKVPVIVTSSRMEEETNGILDTIRHETVVYKPYSLNDVTNVLNRLTASSERFRLSGGKNIDERLSNIFIRAGIPPHIKGYQYLRVAVKLAINQPDIVNSITKKLYPTVAEYFNTSASKVERAIRHAIEVAWSRGKIENINAIFGIKIYGKGDKPTNGELIALVADKMVIEMMPE